ncbi:protein-glutamate O-methyltransferase CheR [Acidocella sp.]|uniref:CheR family methyltransferase n=1 Tax=Acidocella sp. TaxID=50710 RepID=UPI00262C0558|nr:protein-glutamate O-methyltransferase CheR [Acidocella sp.]
MSTVIATSPQIVENAEFAFTATDLDAIVRIMMQETGISLSRAKGNLIYSRLAKHLRRLGLRSFAQYCQLVESQAGEAERQEMIAALTTNVTRFYREPHHFEHMRAAILPGLIARARRGERIRLWSSACSTGQEPYSIALTLLAAMPDAPRFDIKILGTDIDGNVLAHGAAGIYEDALLEPVPAALRTAWFAPVGEGRMQANATLRGLVTFRKLNLIGNWPMRHKFQVIFCRNVVIYFEPDTQETIWSHMLPLLDDHGALYIGHSERISGAAESQLRSDGITIYRKTAPGVAP